MTFRQGRFIQHEFLDDEPPERACGSLRDLVTINRIAGGHRALRDALEACVTHGEAFTFLDVGAASGDAARLVSKLYPGAITVSMDYRLHHVRSASGTRVAADAFRMPFRERSFDIVYCGLFLHHFPNSSVSFLLNAFGKVARRFVIANDLERHVVPFWFLPATKWIFGWDPITLHDGPISVQAAFTQAELSSLAAVAGLRNAVVRRFRPSFRLCLVAEPAQGSE